MSEVADLMRPASALADPESADDAEEPVPLDESTVEEQELERVEG